jgi:hypothetical protein
MARTATEQHCLTRRSMNAATIILCGSSDAALRFYTIFDPLVQDMGDDAEHN